jgi:branched-chain amino acid aminotransferase
MDVTTAPHVHAEREKKNAEPQAWLNGEFISLSDAKVSVTDIGLLRGFGVYEGLITHNREPFRLADHLERLRNSAARMSLTVPAADADIGAVMRALVAHNVPEGEALVRIILTGGTAVGVIEYDPQHPTMYMLADRFEPIQSHYLENGCTVTVVEYHRDLADIKSINYIKTVLLQKERKAAGALEILYTSQGLVLEGGGSNLFIVKDNKVITPATDIVKGITRKVVLELVKDQFAIEERPVTVEEMYAADEAFITGSFKEVVPVVKAGTRTIGDGAPGRITKNILALYHDYTRNYRG